MSSDDLTGKSVSHYAILKRLGEGGMGVVYQAEDTSLKRIVALKFIRPEAGRGREGDARFRREAEAAAALNHPHIATIHEIGEAEGRLFIAMEFVDGPNLRELLAAGPIDLDRGLDLALQLAGALQAAHAKGIIHRDIKTDNIMVTREGSAKVMDFGLARPADPESATLTAGIIGTVPYMSPEQACGDPVDYRTDIWSLGIVLYEMFGGRHPFRAKTEQATLAAIITDEPEPLLRLRPGLPPELQRIIGRCLEKNPERRYAGAGGLKADLDRLSRTVAHQTVTAVKEALSRPGPARDLKGYRRRIPILPGALLVLAAAAFLIRPIRDPVARWLGFRTAPVFTLAVLPFEMIGGDDKDRVFGAGIVDLLTDNLAQVERFQETFRIVSATDVRPSDPSATGKARRAFWGADRVISGGMQFFSDQVVVTLNLIDAKEVRLLNTPRTISLPREGLAALPEAVTNTAAALLDLDVSAKTRKAWAARESCGAEASMLCIQARGYLQRYDMAKNVEIAISLFRKAVEEIDPACAVAYAGLGEAYYRQYNLTNEKPLLNLAQQAAERALQLDEDMPEVHVILGILHHVKGNLENSVQALEKASRLDPSNEAAFRELGTVYDELGRLEEAEQSYRKAITLRPEAWSGYRYLGVFYYQHDRFEEAEKYFLRITDLTPDNHVGFELLGINYLQMGKFAQAEAMLLKSLALEPTADAYSNLGTAYFFDRRYSEAIAAFRNAISLGNNWSTIWGNLGDAYRFVPGSKAEARWAYETAVKLVREELDINPHNSEALMRLARYHVLLGEREAALKEIEQARSRKADTAAILETAVQVYESIGERELALEALKERAKLGPLILIEANPDLAELRKDPSYRMIVEGEKK